MPDQDYVKPKRWEGKPLPYKIKFAVANYPEFSLCALVFGVVVPIFWGIRAYCYPGSRLDGLKKFKATYMVIREDDPRLEEFEREKQVGVEHFPKL